MKAKAKAKPKKSKYSATQVKEMKEHQRLATEREKAHIASEAARVKGQT